MKYSVGLLGLLLVCVYFFQGARVQRSRTADADTAGRRESGRERKVGAQVQLMRLHHPTGGIYRNHVKVYTLDGRETNQKRKSSVFDVARVRGVKSYRPKRWKGGEMRR